MGLLRTISLSLAARLKVASSFCSLNAKKVSRPDSSGLRLLLLMARPTSHSRMFLYPMNILLDLTMVDCKLSWVILITNVGAWLPLVLVDSVRSWKSVWSGQNLYIHKHSRYSKWFAGGQINAKYLDDPYTHKHSFVLNWLGWFHV